MSTGVVGITAIVIAGGDTAIVIAAGGNRRFAMIDFECGATRAALSLAADAPMWRHTQRA